VNCHILILEGDIKDFDLERLDASDIALTAFTPRRSVHSLLDSPFG
jgi:hypothetical protein